MTNTTYNVLTPENGALIKAWTKGVQLEDAARQQLLNVAQMPFIYKWVAAMPDVHWGIGATVGQVEDQIARWGTESPHFQAALLNLSRIGPVLMRWIAKHGKPESTLVKSYRWTDALKGDVKEAIETGLYYSTFLSCFPMWYRDRLSAEFLSDSVVRFTVPGGSRERQVSAYHKGFRPKEGHFQGMRGKRVEQSSSVKRLFGAVLQDARSTGLHKFRYNDSPELVAALMPEYNNRVNTILRRADSIDLGGYTMQEFKLSISPF